MKHIRSGDLYAARLFGAHLLREGASLLRRLRNPCVAGVHWIYLRNIGTGIWRSYELDVDRRSGL